MLPGTLLKEGSSDGQREAQGAEDVDEDLSGDGGEALVVETLLAAGDGGPGLAHTEPDVGPVEEEEAGHEGGERGALEELEEAAWT